MLTMVLGSGCTVDDALLRNICFGVFLKRFLHSQAETQSASSNNLAVLKTTVAILPLNVEPEDWKERGPPMLSC